MSSPRTCPECGAPWPPGMTCEDHFHLLLFWEWEYDLQEVHHLMVLCYHLQHPSLYSPEALREGRELLARFVEEDASPVQVRRDMQAAMASGGREWRVRGRPEAHGSYEQVEWTTTIADVAEAGPGRYYESVREWACSVHEALKVAG